MGTNNYRKTNHVEKSWLDEIDFICTPKKTKHWIKKFLSRQNRRKARKETEGWQDDFSDTSF